MLYLEKNVLEPLSLEYAIDILHQCEADNFGLVGWLVVLGLTAL